MTEQRKYKKKSQLEKKESKRQKVLDELYEKSCEGRYFNHLYDLIIEKENIKAAYDVIKKKLEARQRVSMGIRFNI